MRVYMPGISRVLVPAVAAALALAGCAGRPGPYEELYAGLREDLPVPGDVLAGRRIVIDPGHGGAFAGCVGADSLSEADVNLGVALYLWGLLQDSGADVRLTRSTDRDFLEGPAPDSLDLRELLPEDLSARVGAANSFEPDVFLSIHHNSNIALDRERNGIEVYYRGDDHGGSLELATDIHSHLARNLGIPGTAIRPGNYYVLRNSAAGAAVLGEASYLSNPAVESRLKLSAKQRLEAEAYYLGLVDYFSRGIPELVMTAPSADTLDRPGTVAFEIRPGAGVPVDPASIETRLDGEVAGHYFDPSSGLVTFEIPRSISNGTHEIELTAVSVRGGTARAGPRRIFLDRPAAWFIPLGHERKRNGSMSLSVLVLDAEGRPVAEGKTVLISASGSTRSVRRKTHGGVARFSPGPGFESGSFTVMSDSASGTISYDISEARTGRPVLVLDASTGDPVSRPVAAMPDGRIVQGNDEGFLELDPGDTLAFELSADGYVPVLVDPGLLSGGRVTIPPVFSGALAGRRIALDPAGGGADDFGRSADAIRGATVNLSAAGEISRIVASAGGTCVLTRYGEEDLSMHERISIVNRSRVDAAIRLAWGSFAGEGCIVTHYPGSDRGVSIASSLAEGLEGLPPCSEVLTAGSSDLFLQQTGSPAVEIHGAGMADPEDAAVLVSERWRRLAAQAVICALIAHLSEGEVEPYEHSVRVLSEERPVPGVPVTLDGAATLITGPDGTAVFKCVTPGGHVLTTQPGNGAPPVTVRAGDLAPGGETVVRLRARR